MAQPDSMRPAGMIDVEVCWVEPSAKPQLVRRSLTVAESATVGAVLHGLDRPDLLQALADGVLTVAVFGEHASPATVVHPGDRIELLAGLVADAKQSRARRAEVQRSRQGDARWQRR